VAVHRLIEADGACFLFKGDNVPADDGRVPKANLLGKVTRVERDGRSVHLGLGRERVLIAFLNRTCLLPALLTPVRKLYRLFVPKIPAT
jgi:hypothetical protein